MIYVSELENSALPQEFVNLLPYECDSCGADTEITETLTILKCSNPNCGEKSVQRLVTLLKDLGVKNMGESKCRQFLEFYDITNPYAVFMYEPSDGPIYEGASMEFSEAIYEQIDEKRKMLLWEYVKIGNLPGIRDSARKMLSGYDSLLEFYDDIEAGGIDAVQELLDIKGKQVNSDNYFDDEVVSIKAVDTYNTLITHKDELLQAIDYVDIKELTTEVVNICISTAVGPPYTSKQDFVSQMNEEFGEKVHLNFLGSVTRDVQFLIWSKEGAATSKVKKAEKINEKRILQNQKEGLEEEAGLIHVMTGQEFKEYLSKM